VPLYELAQGELRNPVKYDRGIMLQIDIIIAEQGECRKVYRSYPESLI